MNHPGIAILEHKKEPFLNALMRTGGKVAPACRAVRISRDAVYDWRHADAKFRRAFDNAKKSAFDNQTGALSECFEFFLSIIKPVIPSQYYTASVAALNLSLTNRNLKAGTASTVRSASRKRQRLPSFDVHPELADSENGGSRHAQGKNGTLT